MATLPASIERNSKLYTLARDPLTMQGTEGVQTPTRPMVGWMEAVNESLEDLLFETVVEISDTDIDQFGTVNNFALLGADVIRFTNTMDLTLTGIIPTRTSQQVILLAVGAGKVDITNASSLSLATSQILTGVRATISMAPGAGYARLYYDGTDAQWRVITFEQGAAIAVPYVASDYFATSPGTWTVPSSAVLTNAFYLHGSLLHVSLRLLATTPLNIPDGTLFVKLPQQYVAKKHSASIFFMSHEVSPALNQPGIVQVVPSARNLQIQLFNTPTVGLRGSVDVIGQINMEIGSAGTDIDPAGAPVPVTGGGPEGTTGGGGGTSPGGVVPTSTLPNEFGLIQQIAADNPRALLESCQDVGGNWDFMDLCVAALKAKDSRWGFNGKRGDVNDPSQDAVAYYWGPGAPFDEAGECFVVDIIGGHCGDDPSAQFLDVTDFSGAVSGTWLNARPM